MMSVFNIALLLFICVYINAQGSFEFAKAVETKTPIKEKTIFYKIADNTIPIKIQQYGERSDIVFINLHDDEATSVDAAKRILEESGGLLIEIENNSQRNISFRLGAFIYKVDPNRIFSKEGITKSLSELGRTSMKAIDEASKLGQRILQLIPPDAGCIIALHNNTDDIYSIIDYTPGKERSADSRKVYINPDEDVDDFFLTTDNSLYEKIADKGFNTILQDNKRCTEDGSLSVYCGKRNMLYVNCETEHGKSNQYYQMIKELLSILQEKK